jgi:flagellar motor protein MotB
MRSILVPPNERKKIRVEESSEVHLEHGEESWAVSYSDMLMVLMSFFIIFFSIDSGKKQDVLSEITMFLGQQAGQRGSGEAETAGKTLGKGDILRSRLKKARRNRGEGVSESQGDLQEMIYQALINVNLPIVTEQTNKHIEVVFPDNIYAPRRFKLTNKNIAALEKILTALVPMKDNIELFFVGHTDDKQIRNKDQYMTSNYTLSTLRAANALENAIILGFPATQMFAQGGADNKRNSRTLSLKIKHKILEENSKEDSDDPRDRDGEPVPDNAKY